MIIRASSLSKIMTNPRTKAARQAGELSETAKSEVKKMVKEPLLYYKDWFTSKEVKKGIECEQDSIDLYNEVFFTSYKKNEERKTNDYITGECDIDTGPETNEIIDIKTSWSKKTFPASPYDVNMNDYEWQMRAYMMLWNRGKASVVYCLVDTPMGLRGHESNDLHDVSEIDPPLRITKVTYYRDEEKEKLIKDKIIAARKYAKQYKKEISMKVESYL